MPPGRSAARWGLRFRFYLAAEANHRRDGSGSRESYNRIVNGELPQMNSGLFLRFGLPNLPVIQRVRTV
jgi:hypothetical protein